MEKTNRTRKYRILIVDDDPVTVNILTKFVNSMGFEPISAFSASQGYETAKKEHPDLILLDLNLPDQTGVDIIPALKLINEATPIIMVSGSKETNDVVSAMQAGASDYVHKPIDTALLAEKIIKLIEMKKLTSIKKNIIERSSDEFLLGQSPKMKRVIVEISKIANSDAPVLILGESGTGKSLAANLIHKNSSRRDKPFVSINCAAIPSNLLESELFGHVKGAFTGAVSDKKGKFEAADKGTIFLDEIGDLLPELQVKLLRVLQGQEFERVGSLVTIKGDVRVIAATNRNLEEAIASKSFREDLYYRLNVLPLVMPPLRERKEDIPVLLNNFIKRFSDKENKSFKDLNEKIVNHLSDYGWPGNVRELQNVVERAIVMGKEPELKMSDFTIGSGKRVDFQNENQTNSPVTSIKDLEYSSLIKAIEKSSGNISRASKILGISRDTIYRRLKKYGIRLK